MIVGHAQPVVVKALTDAAVRGTSYGAPTAAEADLAQLIVERIPSIEMVRFVNSGTEATMSAVRLARAATGRDVIIKFDGCYHGHADPFLVAAGSGAMTLGHPDSPGVPVGTASLTVSLPYNNCTALRAAFEARGQAIAAVIVEPIVGNMGVVKPTPHFLQEMRELTAAHGALLIFDEVITGFRAARGGAQELFGIRPDLTTLGKIIGGGLPVGAYGGPRRLMDMIAPSGPVYQAGTLSGNPLAMAAGIATLQLLDRPDTYEQLEQLGNYLAGGLRSAAQEAGVSVSVAQAGSVLTVFFSPHEIHNYDDARQCDTASFGQFHAAMLRQGVYLPPSQFEAWFISLAHSYDDLDRTLASARVAFQEIANCHS